MEALNKKGKTIQRLLNGRHQRVEYRKCNDSGTVYNALYVAVVAGCIDEVEAESEG